MFDLKSLLAIKLWANLVAVNILVIEAIHCALGFTSKKWNFLGRAGLVSLLKAMEISGF